MQAFIIVPFVERALSAENWIPDWTDYPNSASNPWVDKATSTFINKYSIHCSIPSSEINEIFQATLPGGERLRGLVPVLQITLHLLPAATHSLSRILGTTAGFMTWGHFYWASLHFKSLLCKMESEGIRVFPTFTFHVFKKKSYSKRFSPSMERQDGYKCLNQS